MLHLYPNVFFVADIQSYRDPLSLGRTRPKLTLAKVVFFTGLRVKERWGQDDGYGDYNGITVKETLIRNRTVVFL